MNQKGFTLIEMLIVLLIISVLLIVTIPNLTENTESIRNKGCEALVLNTSAQVESYYIEYDEFPVSLEELVDENYITQTQCPNGDELTYDSESGHVGTP
ncbi:competence type IV pilus major pilin ComGC [Halobacillus sp. A5]|uniref:competence type IV pilus major pilin ComGC n=1 Tax=Halobacillus sp. A5 TaxID=2880263 RepID=UPI0020A66313|nr:competence type IV pilus major pilin ComGC [Halobacillus sp. A5]MCP3025698.1 prepilin-type N-terminal cleavage/methylation domain-containing protein [Halobacillus sp. A5]